MTAPISAAKATLFGLFLLGLTLLAGALYLGVYSGFSAQEFEATIRSWGAWGVVCSIGLMIAHSFLPFPAEFLAIANGMAYGPVWGAAITWTGAMLGAYLALAWPGFWAGRSSRRWWPESIDVSLMNGRPSAARFLCWSAALFPLSRSIWSITPPG